jgi:hypothetical protein
MPENVLGRVDRHCCAGRTEISTGRLAARSSPRDPCKTARSTPSRSPERSWVEFLAIRSTSYCGLGASQAWSLDVAASFPRTRSRISSSDRRPRSALRERLPDGLGCPIRLHCPFRYPPPFVLAPGALIPKAMRYRLAMPRQSSASRRGLHAVGSCSDGRIAKCPRLQHTWFFP